MSWTWTNSKFRASKHKIRSRKDEQNEWPSSTVGGQPNCLRQIMPMTSNHQMEIWSNGRRSDVEVVFSWSPTTCHEADDILLEVWGYLAPCDWSSFKYSSERPVKYGSNISPWLGFLDCQPSRISPPQELSGKGDTDDHPVVLHRMWQLLWLHGSLGSPPTWSALGLKRMWIQV